MEEETLNIDKKFIPDPDCSCLDCRKDGYCDACEDFGCQLDDFRP